uniref:Uncharacterized protein n=1 Tax=Glossina pallidipes TaxID=7398 RepID=A0A1A9ZT91_GLOPL
MAQKQRKERKNDDNDSRNRIRKILMVTHATKIVPHFCPHGSYERMDGQLNGRLDERNRHLIQYKCNVTVVVAIGVTATAAAAVAAAAVWLLPPLLLASENQVIKRKFTRLTGRLASQRVYAKKLNKVKFLNCYSHKN